MKQEFNVGVAVRYGVYAAVIVNVMIALCKAYRKVERYNHNGKIVIPTDYILDNVETFMNRRQYNEGIKRLIDSGIIDVVECSDLLFFTDKAKEIFRKKPIRILITWQ